MWYDKIFRPNTIVLDYTYIIDSLMLMLVSRFHHQALFHQKHRWDVLEDLVNRNLLEHFARFEGSC
jgi:hypothetical protein